MIKRQLLPTSLASSLLILLVVRSYFPERDLESTGPAALWDTFFALALAALTFITVISLGHWLLKRLGFVPASLLTTGLISTALGFGLLGYLNFAIGMFGLFQPVWLALTLIGASLVGGQSWATVWWPLLVSVPMRLRGFPPRSGAQRLTFGLILIGIVITFSQALTPPISYDVLMYHLYTPAQYLRLGAIEMLASPVQTNYPMTIQLVFAIGLAFGSPVFAKVITFGMSLGLAALTYDLGRRLVRGDFAIMASAALFTTPVFLFWAQTAFVDTTWAFFEFGAVLCAFQFRNKNQRGWLILAALLSGLAIGIKYQAILGGFALGLWILWHSRTQGWRQFISDAATFGIFSLGIAAPWFLRNLIWTGNPIFPYVFGGPGWSDFQLEHLAAVVSNSGVGFSFPDFLLIPVHLYLNNQWFSTLTGLEFPSFIFLLLFLYPLINKAPEISQLAGLLFLRYLAWTAAQHARYLIPLFPALSLISVYVLQDLVRRWRLRSWTSYAVISAAMLFALSFPVLYSLQRPAFGVITGRQSKSEYLDLSLNQYSSIDFILSELAAEDRVYFLWDGRGFYCDERCVPDRAQQTWPMLYHEFGTPIGISQEIRSRGGTHLFYSKFDLEFFIEHDPVGLHQESIGFLIDTFIPQCGKVVFEDRQNLVVELTCP
jgi:hypothetical protein